MSDDQKKVIESVLDSVDESRRKVLKGLLIGGVLLAAPLSSSVALGDHGGAAGKKAGQKKKAGRKKKAGKKKAVKKKTNYKKRGAGKKKAKRK